MEIDGLVIGLLDNSRAINSPSLAAKYRGLTISWSRFGYRDVFLERPTVDEILDAASVQGFRYVLVQPYGHVILENWTPDSRRAANFFAALNASIHEIDFLVIGTLVNGGANWYGFETSCLLVDLEHYRELGGPRFDLPCDRPRKLPEVTPVCRNGRTTAWRGSTATAFFHPTLPGWHFVAASLKAGLPVVDFSEDARRHAFHLPTAGGQRQELTRYLDNGIARYSGNTESAERDGAQNVFLQSVQWQAANSRRAVFLWNIESYDDIESPPPGLDEPLLSLYSVAAGFKPNRILQTHGFNQRTKVVYFDYSRNGLAVKQTMVERWDGVDFPDFVRQLFEEFPYPDTCYQLWHQCTPANVDWNDIVGVWQRELQRWGGERKFRDHWRAYRELAHEYVCCNILEDPLPLLERISLEPTAVIWWSNAFFTVYGNWFYSLEQRRRAYEDWIAQLVVRNPQLYVCGSDHTNSNVNGLQVSSYYQYYCQQGGDYLNPCRAYRTQIRM